MTIIIINIIIIIIIIIITLLAYCLPNLIVNRVYHSLTYVAVITSTKLFLFGFMQKVPVLCLSLSAY